jgi:hypothetical protein
MFKRLSTGMMLNVNKRALKWAMPILIACSLYSCGESNDAPDVSDVKITLSTRRLDQDMAKLDTNNLAVGLQQLQGKYPDFLSFYLDTLISLGTNGNYSDTNIAIQNGLRSYLTHKDYRGVFDTVIKHYPDTKKLDAELEKGFRYMKHYYPDYHVPKVVYLVSWLNNWGAFTYDSTIVGIGLDMFLGERYPYYQAVGIPQYWSEQLKSGYIPVAVFKAIYRDKQPFAMEGKNLLDMMIQRGKEMYFLDHILPDAEKHTKLAYTQKQLEWCEANEALIYNFFVAQNFLYETNWQKILRYVNEGPNSAGLPESPGNVGTWLGWQIVKAYAAQNPKMTLEQIINDKQEAQQFLLLSKYKPK